MACSGCCKRHMEPLPPNCHRTVPSGTARLSRPPGSVKAAYIARAVVPWPLLPPGRGAHGSAKFRLNYRRAVIDGDVQDAA